MSNDEHGVRTHETVPAAAWPVRTETVSHIGDACVIQGSGDFDLADLNSVRRRFTDRHVTLDGDVITVWPPAPQEMREDSARVAIGAGD
ncbi:hypothetical protein [Streptomyces sp. NPDC002540]